MRLTFLGTGDAFHGGGRGHSSVLVEDAGGRMLIDCGPTVPLALARAGVAPGSIDAVVLTHLHGDHFGGLPFLFLHGMFAAPRTGPLTVVGPRASAGRVEALFALLYPGTADKERPFPVHWHEVEPGQSLTIGRRRLSFFRADHMSGEFTALCVRLESEGKVAAFSGDTGPEGELEQVSRGADVFVCECSHASGEEASPRHLSIDRLRGLRPTWSARRVVLVHLSAAARAQVAALAGVEAADDGLTVEP